jgi:hypothetical protein
MFKTLRKTTFTKYPLLAAMILFVASGIFCAAQERQYSAKAWSFGVMGDTQWTTTDPAGANPNRVSVSIIRQLNEQFIRRGVKFVIQMGDGEDYLSAGGISTRAAAAQPLYDAGIGFFPIRIHHILLRSILEIRRFSI